MPTIFGIEMTQGGLQYKQMPQGKPNLGPCSLRGLTGKTLMPTRFGIEMTQGGSNTSRCHQANLTRKNHEGEGGGSTLGPCSLRGLTGNTDAHNIWYRNDPGGLHYPCKNGTRTSTPFTQQKPTGIQKNLKMRNRNAENWKKQPMVTTDT